jgi:hypothetical protein
VGDRPGGLREGRLPLPGQDFEYDWSGVIIGPDLVWRDGGWNHGPVRSPVDRA